MQHPVADPSDPTQNAYERGRRVGLATSALALGVVSYVNLLGIEKSLLAIVLAALAIKGPAVFSIALRRGRIALVLAAIHAVSVIALIVIFRERLTEFLQHLA